jgi:hypothetical protein
MILTGGNPMNIVFISVAHDFSKTPGPRLRGHGPHSAEEFFNTRLAPGFAEAVRRDAQLLVDFDGTAGVAASFLDEAFGRLARRFGRTELDERLLILAVEEPHLEAEILRYIESAAGAVSNVL